jgi:DnaJ family protein B protein 4
MTDYYGILQLEKGCSDEDIRKAYKKMALKWHPDRNKGNETEANEKFREIAQAYSVLSDPNKRKMYDVHGITDPQDSSGSPFGNFDFDQQNTGNIRFTHVKNFGNVRFAHNIFEQVFGSNNPFDENDEDESMKFHRNVHNRMHNSHMKRQFIPTIEHELKCTLEELYSGTQKKVKIGETKVDISVMPGWKEGTKVTFDNIENNKIIFVISQKDHKSFVRDDNNLAMTITIDHHEALKGFKRSISLIDGTTEEINLKGIPSSDYKYTIKNKGMPIRKNGKHDGYGNLIINFIVKFK